MANPFSKGWKYLMQSLDTKIEENADPHVQIQQATEAARKQHQQISESAARVIGNRNQLEMKMNRLQEDAEKLSGNARTAIQQADKAAADGDQAKANELNQTAELFASQLVTVEQQLEETKRLYSGAEEAARQAQQQQQQSAARLEDQMAPINQLRSQVDQAKMQEATANSMQQMDGLVQNNDVPTLDSVREKIEQRYAQALGGQELVENSVQGRMSEIESVGNDMRASSRLEEIRAQLNAENGANALEQGEGSGNGTGEAQGELER